MSQEQEQDQEQDRGRLSFGQTVASVLAAFFGVQSSKNRHRDFKRGSPLAFIVVAIGLTAAFVGLLALLVQVILAVAT